MSRLFFFRPMVLLVTAIIFLLPVFSACQSQNTAGGPLPAMLAQDAPAADARLTSVSSPIPDEENTSDITGAQNLGNTADGGRSVSPQVIGDDAPVSRALVAKMLALTYADMNTIDGMDKEILFSDVQPDAWYSKYINAACGMGLMAGAGEKFLPEEALTLEQAYSLLSQLDPDKRPGIELSPENTGKPLSYALWVELYKKLLDSASQGQSINESFGVEGVNFVVLATSGNNPHLSAGQMITDTGAFTHYGMDMDVYIDKGVRVFHKDREIIALDAVTQEQPILSNAYITAADNQGITVFSGGAARFYGYGKDCPPAPSKSAGKVCDILISSGTALSVTVTEEILTGTVLKTTPASVEFKEWGTMPVDERFKVYEALDNKANQVKWKDFNDLLVGTDIAGFYVKDGILRAAVIVKEALPETVRVVIGTSDYAGLIHNSVSITATEPFTVTGADGEKAKYAAGRPFTVSDIENTDLWGGDRLYIASDKKDGRLVFTGLKRNWPDNTAPRYRGVIEIAREPGGYSVVNELSMEEYLYAVIPSEMPTGYGEEACKAQAVTARSYACTQFFDNRFHAYGGHVDDSVASQVYNNIPENEVSIKAVDATKGRCLTYNGEIITANFFSSSSGMTANSGEVWAAPSGGFPAPTSAYLTAQPQFTFSESGKQPANVSDSAAQTGNEAASGGQDSSVDYGDLTNEDNASSFFKDGGVTAYDSGFPWFRWQVRMTVSELSASVNAQLAARYNIAPHLIKTRTGADKTGAPAYRSQPVEGIGILKDISVIRRGEGGNIMALLLTGTEAEVLVYTEYNIRLLLAPAKQGESAGDILLTRSDGSSLTNYTLMPSAFLTFDKEHAEDGTLTAVSFFGGGNGHGVGMSQNGVKGMTDQGAEYEEALTHYYPGTKMKKIY